MASKQGAHAGEWTARLAVGRQLQQRRRDGCYAEAERVERLEVVGPLVQLNGQLQHRAGGGPVVIALQAFDLPLVRREAVLVLLTLCSHANASLCMCAQIAAAVDGRLSGSSQDESESRVVT
jgi:hypothetical protein